MATDALKAIWRDGGTAFGAWVSLPVPLVAEAASLAAYDYACLDMQHGLVDYGDAVAMLGAMARGPAVPLVRVPWNEPGIIGRVLDAGALGVIIPMVNNPEEAARAVAACRYAPAGARSVGPVRAVTTYGPGYVSDANDHVACIPMIETREAIESIDEILRVPGIDAVYVGPSDLSLSYGLAPAPDHPGEPFEGALATVLDACHRHGVVPGIHANAGLAAKRHEQGFRMVTVGIDFNSLLGGLRRDLATAREATGSSA